MSTQTYHFVVLLAQSYHEVPVMQEFIGEQ